MWSSQPRLQVCSFLTLPLYPFFRLYVSNGFNKFNKFKNANLICEPFHSATPEIAVRWSTWIDCIQIISHKKLQTVIYQSPREEEDLLPEIQGLAWHGSYSQSMNLVSWTPMPNLRLKFSYFSHIYQAMTFCLGPANQKPNVYLTINCINYPPKHINEPSIQMKWLQVQQLQCEVKWRV